MRLARRLLRISLCVAGLGLLAPSLALGKEDKSDIEFFEKRIRPVLVEKCYSCHSVEAQKKKKLRGGLLLDTRAGLRKGGDNGTALVPGKPDEGTLLKALRHSDELKMPPGGRLPDAVLADFQHWIRRGAPDPREGQAATVAAIDWEHARKHWSFRAPVNHPLPEVMRSEWPRNWIDRFVLAALEKRGLQPTRPADRRELIRRASFDLIGLPPTPELVDAFLKDESPDAFARVIDRLLASPHYGERWGRHWLDVSRYAEDKALAFPTPRPHAYRYRDWVVRAFNNDMPYDRFLRLQLAGDLVPEPIADPTLKLAGLGFQGLGAEYHKGSVPEQVKADELDDRIDTLTRGLLGLTVACARCHDHKYDPIPTLDYYSLAAAYNGAGLTEVVLAPPNEVESFRAWEQKSQTLDADLKRWLSDQGSVISKAAMRDVGRYLLAAWRLRILKTHMVPVNVPEIAKQDRLHPFFLNRCLAMLEAPDPAKSLPALKDWLTLATTSTRDLRPSGTTVVVPEQLGRATAELERTVRTALDAVTTPSGKSGKPAPQDRLLEALGVRGGKGPFALTPAEVSALLDDLSRQRYTSLQAEITHHKQTKPPAPARAHGVSGGGQAMRVHIRGSVEHPGEPAPPGFLRILDVRESKRSERGTFTRLDLAEQIASSRNPLTARVLVNRVWHQHFGRGIVGTPSNFGKLGDLPTHPELLDSLAVRFIEAGWSIKWLHRELMLSATYQLGSSHSASNAAIDPDNHYLWRHAPRRLDVEAWRDAILLVSGRLERGLGGLSSSLSDPAHLRRTLYSKVSRLEPDKMLTLFDFPDANVTSERRNSTLVPQQQLFVLNSEFMVEAAKAMAARLNGIAGSDQERIALAYRWSFGRSPSPRESEIALAFLRGEVDSREARLTNLEQFCQAVLASNEFTWID